MKILFIGGTGVISSACAKLCIERGDEVHLLTRGTSFRAIPEGAKPLQGDINDPALDVKFNDFYFDAVVDWIAYKPADIERDLQLFRKKTGQYIFISSASAYQTPPLRLPVTESTPLANPYWQYSRDKIACEERLIKAYREEQFPVTIVRPSHTYDPSTIPLLGYYTAIDRMYRGKPIVIHGDGTSLWTLTHHRDFARGFYGLLGNPQVLGDSFHITSDEVLSWNQIAAILANAAGVRAGNVHVASDTLAGYNPDWAGSLLGDKSHSMVFDNSKIKSVVPDYKAVIPFFKGAREIIDWYKLNKNRRIVDPKLDFLFDELATKYSVD